jgi:CheY-like chemotaxis protein
MSNKTILIIDDCIVFLKAMSMKLRAHGYDVVTAVDGSAAVSTIRQMKPDLILLDLNFPPDVAHGGGVSWDGYLILNWIRRMEDSKNVPIIIISISEVIGEREQLRANGVVDFFLKPVDHEELLTAVQRALKESTRPHSEPVPESSGKILFVDDEGDWRYMATLYLTECGYEVMTAGDATEALKRASEFQPQLIVLDMRLGDENGDTLLKLLDVTYPQTPILAYSGKELDEAAVQDLLDQGAYRYLHKATMEDLLVGVSEAMNDSVPASEFAGSGADKAEDEPTEPSAESVLVLEDDIGFGDTLLLFLEAQGFAVTRVTDGAEGLRQILAADFDYIICDMVMPNMPGEQFYRAVEERKPELCKRFIFMTGHQADPRSDIFIRRVRGLMLWKPFALADLLTATQIVRRRSQEGLIRASETPGRANSGGLRMEPR